MIAALAYLAVMFLALAAACWVADVGVPWFRREMGWRRLDRWARKLVREGAQRRGAGRPVSSLRPAPRERGAR